MDNIGLDSEFSFEDSPLLCFVQKAGSIVISCSEGGYCSIWGEDRYYCRLVLKAGTIVVSVSCLKGRICSVLFRKQRLVRKTGYIVVACSEGRYYCSVFFRREVLLSYLG